MRTSLAITGLVALLACAGGPAAADVYTVTVENLIPGGAEMGQPMTPPLAVVHSPAYSLVTPGSMATKGLELLAEDGVTADLAAEAKASGAVKGTAVGAKSPFFDYVEFTVEGAPGDLLSVVTMLARTNDLITGVFSLPLPRVGARSTEVPVLDAGTEQNTGMVKDIPFYGNSMVGPDEHVPIKMIECYSVSDDPKQGTMEWCFPPAARISVCHGGMGHMEGMGSEHMEGMGTEQMHEMGTEHMKGDDESKAKMTND